MDFTISFHLGTFPNSAEAFKLISRHITRPLTAIKSTEAYDGGDWIDNYAEVEEKLSSSKEQMFLAHDSDIFNSFYGGEAANKLIYRNDSIYQLQHLTITYIDEDFMDVQGLLEEACKWNFTLAIQHWDEKSRWQSEQIPSTYRIFNKSLEGRMLYKNPLWPPGLGDLVDIRDNPGREIRTYGCMLMAAPDMWFGPGSWEYFDKGSVLSCPEVIICEEILKDVVYVRLFNPYAEDYEDNDLLDIQRNFRQCSGMDEVEALLNSKLPFTQLYLA